MLNEERNSDADDSCKAPDNFHISSSIDDNESRISCCRVKCPLCNYPRQKFYCCDCVLKIENRHSTIHLSENFSEKKLRYLNIKSSHSKLEIKFNNLINKHKVKETLSKSIEQKCERIKKLKQLIQDKQENFKNLTSVRKQLHDSNRILRIKLPKYEDKVKKLEEYVITRSETTEKRRQNYDELEVQLKFLVRGCIEKLIKYIFPISEKINKNTDNKVRPKHQHHGECSSGSSSTSGDQSYPTIDTMNAIAEATRTAYVQGKWVLQESYGEIQHVIVAPSLGLDDFSTYGVWIASNKETAGVPMSSNLASSSAASNNSNTGANSNNSNTNTNNQDSNVKLSQNPAYRISAALTYTTQLVQILSYYLDVRLPYKLVYGDFCLLNMSESIFTRKVGRLNANILYLCYTQKVKLNSLKPNHTLENIKLILNFSDLGSTGFTDTANCLVESIDTQLVRDLEAGEDSESDDENTFPNEWEALPSISPLELNPTPPSTPRSGVHPQQSMISGGLVTSAAASIASIWRGWTTGR